MNSLNIASIVLVGLALFIAAVPARADEQTTRALHALFDAEWDYTMQNEPTWASSLGDKRWNDKWPDLSLTAIRARRQHNQEVLEKLTHIGLDRLSPEDRRNKGLFQLQAMHAIEAEALGWYLVPITHRDGIQSLDEEAVRWPFNTAKDYEDYIVRLNSFPTYMQQTIELMREGMRVKRIQPKIVMQRVPAQIDKQIVPDAKSSAFYKPLTQFPASIAPAERERLSKAAAEAIESKVIPGYRDFKTFFEKEYFPACLDDVGVWQLPDGENLYATLAQHHTTTSMTPKEIHELGLKEVARIDAEMQQIMKDVGFTGTKAEFFKFLRTDKRFYYPSGEELLAATRALCKRIDPKLSPLFRTIPRLPYGVEPVPDALAPDTTTAYYEQGSADGIRPGCYRVNLYRPDTRPKWEMVPLSLHEAVPGHHFQISRAMELGDLPMFRRHGSYTAYVEGWALYTESLGREMGLYDDPYDRFGMLSYDMWRAVRLVVDTGIHAMKWKRQQAIDYFMEHAPKSELDITNEIDRYIAWPGQALAYKVGQIKIQQLRAKAEQELGSKFDLRDFHDAVLETGAVPLDELEAHIGRWIEQRKAAKAA